MKDIQVVNLEQRGYNLEKFGIVCSGFSSKHLHSTAKTLKNQINKLDLVRMGKLPSPIKMAGQKSSSWLTLSVKEVQVHMLLEEYRYEIDLEFRWLNEPPPEMKKKWTLYEKAKKRGDLINHNEETFQSEETDKNEI